jgi:diguanylate cyclase (GGDEF)-like protein
LSLQRTAWAAAEKYCAFMSQDVTRHLDRAKRFLEKNKLQDAVEEYQAVLEVLPSHQEAVQALADIYVRLNEPARAAHYYGLQFDRLVEAGDTAKATALYARFLKALPQPPERSARYAFLLQRQNKVPEAIEQYEAAGQGFQEKGSHEEALACLEKIAELDPENPARQIEFGELAERAGRTDLASHGFLRAGQLALAQGELDQAVKLLGHAHDLAPQDRSAALLYAAGLLRIGEPTAAVALLEPFSPAATDTVYLSVFGEALLRSGELDRARPVLEAYYRQKPDGFDRLFELVGAYLGAGEDERAVAVLDQVKQWMFPMRRESEFAAQVDQLAEANPHSLPLIRFWAQLYEELNREAKYFDALVRLFDLCFGAGKLQEACEALDRLVDIDPYDYRNQERIAKLEGKADPAYLHSIRARAAKSAALAGRAETLRGEAGSSAQVVTPPESEAARAKQALEDLMVQVEIFLQYSLRPKALERLERIAELFPGEEETNDRLRALYERADWWPRGAAPAQKPKDTPAAAPLSASYTADTNRDLAAIAEITRLLYRQTTPREVLSSAVNEIGKYLGAARCFAAMGPPGEPAQMTGEFIRAGLGPANRSAGAAALAQIIKTPPDPQGGVHLLAEKVPALRELGLETALGVPLTDKETQTPAGVLLVGDIAARIWKPNESFFLQAVGDQLVISVNHTRLRSLVRTLAVADEKTGLLSRGAYIDCLLAETNRARTQGAPLSLVILQVDRGPEWMRQQGEAAFEHYFEQLARHLEPLVRHSDLAVRYSAWSLAFILPDTALDGARALAEKLRQAAAGVRSSWGAGSLAVSVVVAEAVSQPSEDKEDIVTEWINRAEFGLEEARKQGGNAVLALATPR